MQSPNSNAHAMQVITLQFINIPRIDYLKEAYFFYFYVEAFDLTFPYRSDTGLYFSQEELADFIG